MPVKLVFENLEDGMTVDEIIEQYDVTREQVKAVIDFAERSFDTAKLCGLVRPRQFKKRNRCPTPMHPSAQMCDYAKLVGVPNLCPSKVRVKEQSYRTLAILFQDVSSHAVEHAVRNEVRSKLRSDADQGYLRRESSRLGRVNERERHIADRCYHNVSGLVGSNSAFAASDCIPLEVLSINWIYEEAAALNAATLQRHDLDVIVEFDLTIRPAQDREIHSFDLRSHSNGWHLAVTIGNRENITQGLRVSKKTRFKGVTKSAIAGRARCVGHDKIATQRCGEDVFARQRSRVITEDTGHIFRPKGCPESLL